MPTRGGKTKVFEDAEYTTKANNTQLGRNVENKKGSLDKEIENLWELTRRRIYTNS